MRYVAAYLLSALGGNESPSTDDLKTILESVGVGYDDERAALVVKQCAGKSIAELIAAGSEKMASMPAGGGGGGAAAAASGGDAPAAAEEKKEEKKATVKQLFGSFSKIPWMIRQTCCVEQLCAQHTVA